MLTFNKLRRVNVARCEDAFHPLNAWSPTDWATALAGETGELCNKIKKLRRGETVPIEAIASEIADVAIYLDLLAARLELSLGDAIATKFNVTSRTRGSKHILPEALGEDDVVATPNTTRWKRGDIVLHEMDGKKPHMLAHITAADDDALTFQYFLPRLAANHPKGLKATFQMLYDPALFGIDVSLYMPLLRELAEH